MNRRILFDETGSEWRLVNGLKFAGAAGAVAPRTWTPTLHPREAGNSTLPVYPGLIVKESYWRWPQRNLDGNVIYTFKSASVVAAVRSERGYCAGSETGESDCGHVAI